ncbi:PaaI family thioesterase [Acuticoccus sp.]|uniref:PaaI family thioesterase n=1 Tax=Acuticoccus sp. TaxID=1904378 RepID=UPI003B51CADE
MSSPTVDPALLEEPFPLQALLGIELVAWQDGAATCRLPLRAEHSNRAGKPHGGIYTTLLDVALGYAGIWTGDPATRRFAITLSLTTNFVATPSDDVLIAEACRVGGGRSTYFAEGAVRDGLGTLCATACGTFRLR